MSESHEIYEQANARACVRRHSIVARSMRGKSKQDRYIVVDIGGDGTGMEILCRGIRFQDEAQAIAEALNKLSAFKGRTQ